MKLKLSASLVGASLLAVSCGSPASQPVLPADSEGKIASIPGEDSSLPVGLRQGVDLLHNVPKRECVTLGPVRNQPDNENISGATSVFRMTEIKTRMELSRSLNISASASLQGTWGRGSANTSFVNNFNKSERSTYVLIHAKSANQLRFSADPRWVPEVEEVLLNAGNEQEYVESLRSLCGTHFVNGYRTGAEFFALYEFKFEKESELKSFKANLDAQGTLWKARGKFEQATGFLKEAKSQSLTIMRRGSTEQFPEVEGLVDAARNITVNSIDTQSSDQQSVTLELLTMGYDTVLPVIKPNPALSAELERILNELDVERQELFDLRSSIKDVQQNRSKYDISIGFDLKAEDVLSNISERLNIIGDSAVRCIDNPRDCKRPLFPDHLSVTIEIPDVKRTRPTDVSTVEWVDVDVFGLPIQLEVMKGIDRDVEVVSVNGENISETGHTIHIINGGELWDANGNQTTGIDVSSFNTAQAAADYVSKFGVTLSSQSDFPGFQFGHVNTDPGKRVLFAVKGRFIFNYEVSNRGQTWQTNTTLVRLIKESLKTIIIDGENP